MSANTTPTAEQIQALRAFATLHGRNWKSALRQAWMDGDYQGFSDSNFLQQLRNTFGPSWLSRFVLPMTKKMFVKQNIFTAQFTSYAFLTTRQSTIENNNARAQGSPDRWSAYDLMNDREKAQIQQQFSDGYLGDDRFKDPEESRADNVITGERITA